MLQDDPGLSSIFPLPVMESVISPRIPGYFYWRMVLEIKIGVLGVFIANEISFLSGPLNLTEQKTMCLY